MPPPAPPIVNAGRRITGRPISSRNRQASSRVVTVSARGSRKPIDLITAMNFSRFSARSIASRVAPIISIPNLAKVPSSYNAQAVFKAIWPPRVGSRASIGVPLAFSFAMILVTASSVIGSMYVRSENSGSVMIVAGFELTSTMR